MVPAVKPRVSLKVPWNRRLFGLDKTMHRFLFNWHVRCIRCRIHIYIYIYYIHMFCNWTPYTNLIYLVHVSLDDSIVLAITVCEVPDHVDLECQLEPTSLFFFPAMLRGVGVQNGFQWSVLRCLVREFQTTLVGRSPVVHSDCYEGSLESFDELFFDQALQHGFRWSHFCLMMKTRHVCGESYFLPRHNGAFATGIH